jgi:hypothetical protein
MAEVKKYPISLIALSLVIGAIIWGQYFFLLPFIRDINHIGDWMGMLYCLPALLPGAFFGLVSGRIGFSIKPTRSACLTGAALGSVIMVALLPAVLFAIREVLSAF